MHRTEASDRLDRELRLVGRRWLLRDVGLAIAWFALTVIPACLLLGWLDWRLDFSKVTRTLELFGLVALAAWVIRRRVWPALAKRRDMRSIARRVEEARPDFGGHLATRVEFAIQGAPESQSPDLVEAMCRQVEARSPAQSVGKVIGFRRLRWPGLATIGVLGLAVAAAGLRADLASRWVRRTVLPWGQCEWPRRTKLDGLKDHYRVRRGDALYLTGRAVGEIPRSGWAYWRSSQGLTGGRKGRTALAISTDGTFSATIGPLLEPVSVTLEAGDAEQGDIRVDVVVPPELAGVEATYRYPDYTNRTSEQVQSGDVRVLIGTQVALVLTADRPTETMECVTIIGERVEKRPVALTSPTSGEVSLMVYEQGKYQIHLYDEFGFESDNPTTFVIDPIDDQLPKVQVDRPGAEHTVAPSTRLRVNFQANDDYGITGALVQWRKSNGADAEASSDWQETSIPLTSAQREWQDTFTWDLSGTDAAPGDEVEYRLVMQDAGLHLSKQASGMSNLQRLKVVEEGVLKQVLEARLRDVMAQIERLTRQQETGRETVELAIVSLPSGDDVLLPDEIRRIQSEAHRQSNLQSRAARIALQLTQVASELHDTFEDQADRIAALHGMANSLETLSDDTMEEAAIALEQASVRLINWRQSEEEGGP